MGGGSIASAGVSPGEVAVNGGVVPGAPPALPWMLTAENTDRSGVAGDAGGSPSGANMLDSRLTWPCRGVTGGPSRRPAEPKDPPLRVSAALRASLNAARSSSGSTDASPLRVRIKPPAWDGDEDGAAGAAAATTAPGAPGACTAVTPPMAVGWMRRPGLSAAAAARVGKSEASKEQGEATSGGASKRRAVDCLMVTGREAALLSTSLGMAGGGTGGGGWTAPAAWPPCAAALASSHALSTASASSRMWNASAAANARRDT